MTNEIDKARADERRAIANAMDQWSTDPVVTNHEPERVCIAVRAIASLIAHGTYGRLVDAEGLSADVVSAAQIRAESIRADERAKVVTEVAEMLAREARVLYSFRMNEAAGVVERLAKRLSPGAYQRTRTGE
jgi:hypothetical protein